MSQAKREGGQLEDFRWIHIPNQDELEKFYRATIENVKPDAKACGYAIGVHGSLRRDLDLIAVPWDDDHTDKNSLAQAIHEAACGLWETTYQWTQKPCGRWSTSLAICWLDYDDDRPSAGCIDLSVMPASARPEIARIPEANELAKMAGNSRRFEFLQNLPVVQAQAYFWNYSSRKQRAQAIDQDMREAVLAVSPQLRLCGCPGACQGYATLSKGVVCSMHVPESIARPKMEKS